MNQPDRYARFILPEGATKVTYKADTKIENAGTFSMMQEDHTMGNLIRCQLLRDKDVLFAGYRIPHPLEPKMVIRVQTSGMQSTTNMRPGAPSGPPKGPDLAVEHALEDLRSEVQVLREAFVQEFERVAREGGMGMHLG